MILPGHIFRQKIGKNNPLANEIAADNKHRQKWNRTVDQVLIAGGAQAEVTEFKTEEITSKESESIRQNGNDPKQKRSKLRAITNSLKAEGRDQIIMSNIGVFIQTFNPIHDGHILLMNKLKDKLGLDEILLVLSNISRNKYEQLPSVEDRLNMCHLATKRCEQFGIYNSEKNSRDALRAKWRKTSLHEGNW